MSGAEQSKSAKCDRCDGMIREPSIGSTIFFIDRYKVCRPCVEALAKAGYAKRELATQAGRDMAPQAGSPEYFSVEGCKKYVTKWLAHVAGLNASQPRHYLRQRALPPSDESK